MVFFFPSGDGYALEDGLLCAFPKGKLPSSGIEGESPRSSAISRFVEKYGACSDCQPVLAKPWVALSNRHHLFY